MDENSSNISQNETENIQTDEMSKQQDFENTANEILNNMQELSGSASHKKVPKGNGRAAAVILLVLVFVMVCVMTVYCMATDFSTYRINDFSGFSGTKVLLQTQDKPEGSDALTDENGKYTIEGLVSVVKPQIVEIYTYETENTDIISGSGSGIIISQDGYIVTNTHVIDNMKKYTVTTYDGKSYTAEVIGKDSKTDIAVIKIDAQGLSPATLGNSDQVVQGEAVVAIGNPAGLTGSITDGIVSGIDRKIKTDTTSFEMNCIQTNAAISPGNSGGALVNMYGQVIGITSSKYAAVTSEGLGFAITINDAKPIIEELISQGYVSGRVRIGITFYSSFGGAAKDGSYANIQFKEKYGFDIPKELENALWIEKISDDCDIANTELQPEDFIISVNGTKISDYTQLSEVIKGKKGGDKLTAECARVDKNGDIKYFSIEFKLMADTSGDY